MCESLPQLATANARLMPRSVAIFLPLLMTPNFLCYQFRPKAQLMMAGCLAAGKRSGAPNRTVRSKPISKPSWRPRGAPPALRRPIGIHLSDFLMGSQRTTILAAPENIHTQTTKKSVREKNRFANRRTKAATSPEAFNYFHFPRSSSSRDSALRRIIERRQ